MKFLSSISTGRHCWPFQDSLTPLLTSRSPLYEEKLLKLIDAYRYLEDIIPLIKYQPPSVRPNKKETEEEKKAIREQFKDKGLDDTSIHALQSISRSSYIDYQVRFHPSFFHFRFECTDTGSTAYRSRS
jgi:hypothetical protein